MQPCASTHAILLGGAAVSECKFCGTDRVPGDCPNKPKALRRALKRGKTPRVCLICLKNCNAPKLAGWTSTAPKTVAHSGPTICSAEKTVAISIPWRPEGFAEFLMPSKASSLGCTRCDNGHVTGLVNTSHLLKAAQIQVKWLNCLGKNTNFQDLRCFHKWV